MQLINCIWSLKENESEKINCNLIFIYHTPLPCFIFYIKNLNSFYVYSINGKFLQKNKIEYDININGIAQYIDYQMRDYLMIYNSKDKTIDRRVLEVCAIAEANFLKGLKSKTKIIHLYLKPTNNTLSLKLFNYLDLSSL